MPVSVNALKTDCEPHDFWDPYNDSEYDSPGEDYDDTAEQEYFIAQADNHLLWYVDAELADDDY